MRKVFEECGEEIKSRWCTGGGVLVFEEWREGGGGLNREEGVSGRKGWRFETTHIWEVAW